MMQPPTPVKVRAAAGADVAEIVALSGRVQALLTAAGSLQEFGPLALDLVVAKVAAGFAWVLEQDNSVVGAVFVEPLTRASVPNMVGWNLDELRPMLYLSKLMVAPELRGQQLSSLLLQQAQRQADAANALLVLDCWAGNGKLRQLYSSSGFVLHGEFPENDYHIAVFTYN